MVLDPITIEDVINQYSLFGAPFLVLVMAALASKFNVKGGR